MAEEVKLMKGNEAIAHAAIRYGVDGYFGYPITPQSEILETLMAEMPWETTGMVVLQAESEVAAINMVYGGAGTGKRVMTSSSSPGVSLKQEGISYLAFFGKVRPLFLDISTLLYYNSSCTYCVVFNKRTKFKTLLNSAAPAAGAVTAQRTKDNL